MVRLIQPLLDSDDWDEGFFEDTIPFVAAAARWVQSCVIYHRVNQSIAPLREMFCDSIEAVEMLRADAEAIATQQPGRSSFVGPPLSAVRAAGGPRRQRPAATGGSSSLAAALSRWSRS